MLFYMHYKSGIKASLNLFLQGLTDAPSFDGWQDSAKIQSYSLWNHGFNIQCSFGINNKHETLVKFMKVLKKPLFKWKLS